MDRKLDSICDFCSAPNPTWAFPAQSFYHKTEVKPVDKFIHAFMREEWAACNTCAELVHAGARMKLALRVYTAQQIKLSVYAQLFKAELIEEVIKMQDTFRKNRLAGPPVIIQERLKDEVSYADTVG